ncbi:MAG: response regulator [Elusimicrobiota bacterium]
MALGPILLADSDQQQAELALAALKANNLANPVVTVKDGEEALAFLRREGKYQLRGHEDPAAVLLAIAMPGLDGIETLRVIREDPALRALPVILLAASAEELALAKTRNLSANAYLVKPVGFGNFSAAARTAGVFWALLAALPRAETPQEQPQPGAPAPLRVLYLEDSPDDAEIIRALLTAAVRDIRLDHAETREEYGALLGSRAYDIILTDFNIPGFDGFASLKQAADLAPGVPVICISGAIGEETAVALLKAGAVDYLLKDRRARLPSSIERAVAEAKERTARRLATEALRRSETRFRMLSESLPGFVYTRLAGPVCALTFANKAAGTITGYTAQELLADNGLYERAVLPDFRGAVEAAMRAALAGGQPYQLRYRLRRKDAREIWVEEFGTGICDENGRVNGLAGIILDIDEETQAQEQKQRLMDQLQEKKQEMENFLYITTHDLRSPLINIQGFSHNLLKDFTELRETLKAAALPKSVRGPVDAITAKRIPSALNFISESAQKMDHFIGALLKVSRLGRVEMRPQVLDVNAVLRGVLDVLRYQLEETGAAVKAGDLPPCRADADALNHILSNLLANAVKYRDKSRRLEITVRGEKNGPATALYAISDNGIGIGKLDLPDIWRIFSGSRNAGAEKGEGIGLAMSRMMTKKNGGRIWAESKEGEGSVFYIELPA